METFHWNHYFVTGLETVDSQHHGLVDLINRFGNVLEDNSTDEAVLEEIFKSLVAYADFHFAEEEGLMRSAGVDQRHVHQHAHAHQEFLKHVIQLHGELGYGRADAGRRLLEFLSHWLAYHILGQDQNMAHQIHAIKDGKSPAAAYQEFEHSTSGATAILLNSLQVLFAQVSERNLELVALNNSLEKRVHERTRELEAANSQLATLSLTDALTGLPNRRHAMRQLDLLWEEARRDSTPLSCLMIDADHFKEVNDSYGHEAGDIVLQKLANTLQDNLRTDDFVSRVGGDEFLVLCPKTPLAAAIRLGDQLRSKVHELQVPTGGVPWSGSVSVGVADLQAFMQVKEDLIRAADGAVYTAKKDGKNCVRSAN